MTDDQPELHDFVTITERGVGYEMQLRGQITELTASGDITVGHGYTLNVLDDEDIEIKPMDRPTIGPPPGFDLLQFAMQERQYGRRMAASNRTTAFVQETNRDRGRQNQELRSRVKELEGQLGLAKAQEVARAGRPPVEYSTELVDRIGARLAGKELASMTEQDLDVAMLVQNYRHLRESHARLRTACSGLASQLRGVITVFLRDAL